MKQLKKYVDFRHKSGKLAVQIEERNCANANIAKIQKNLLIFGQTDEKYIIATNQIGKMRGIVLISISFCHFSSY